MSEIIHSPEETPISEPVAEPIVAPPPPPSLLRRIFYGADGFRSGWSLLIFSVPFLALYGIGRLIMHYMAATPAPKKGAAPAQSGPLEVILGELIIFGIVALFSFLVSLIEKRSFGLYGLGGIGNLKRLRDFGIGMIWGLVFLSILVGALRVGHLLSFDGLAEHSAKAVVGYGFALLVAFFMVGLAEEFEFRGFLQYTAGRGISGVFHSLFPRSKHAHAVGFWGAALLFSVGFFALAHTGNGGETPLGLAAVAAAGLTFAFSLWRTGTLWWAIGFHTTWDWAQSFLYGVPDSGLMMKGHLLATHPLGAPFWSGGTTGPEGSILLFPTLVLACVVIHFTLPKRDYPVTPSQQPPV